MAGARNVVVLSMLASGAAVVIGGAARGELPRPRRLLAVGFVYVALAALAELNPKIATAGAALVGTGVVLSQGEDAARGVLRGVQSTSRLGTRDVPKGGAPVLGSSSGAPSADPDDPTGAPPAGPVAPGSGSPTIVRGRLIGTPYAGTHKLGNWQSDNALDIGVPNGTAVLAVADGVISKVAGSYAGGSSRFDGYQVTLTGAGNAWFYTHLSAVNVKQGSRVRKGQVIGASGSASGVPHLHIGQQRGDPRDTLHYR